MDKTPQVGDRIFCFGYRGPASHYVYVPPGEYVVSENLDASEGRPFDASAMKIEKGLVEEMLTVEAATFLAMEKRETAEDTPDDLEQVIEQDAEEFNRPRSRYRRKL